MVLTLGLLGELRGSLSLVNFATRLLLSNTLKAITGTAGGVVSSLVPALPLDRVEVLRLLLARVLRQLVGVRLAIMVNNDSTCTDDVLQYDHGGGAYSRRETNSTAAINSMTQSAEEAANKKCSNGAYFLLGATKLSDLGDVQAALDKVFARLGEWDVSNLDSATVWRDGSSLAGRESWIPEQYRGRVTPPYQGKEIYFELLRYLTGGKVYNAGLKADNLLPTTHDPYVADNGVYDSPLRGGTCERIMVVNIMLSESRRDGESDADIKAELPGVEAVNGDRTDLTWAEMREYLATTGFDYNGGHYQIESRFLVAGPEGNLLSNLIGTTMSLPLGINPVAIDALHASTSAPVLPSGGSMGGPQPVSQPATAEAAKDLYVGLFLPDKNKGAAWRGNVKKLTLGHHNGKATVVGALDKPAIGPSGEIATGTLTLWTNPDQLSNEANGTDGGVVDQGGAGMLLPAPTSSNAGGGVAPQIYYQTNAGSIAPLNLDDVTVTEAAPALAAENRLEAAKLIAWARGYETSQAVLGDKGYGGLLGFLNNLVSGLEDLIKSLLEQVLRGLFCHELLGGLLNLLHLGWGCPVPTPVEPPARDWQMGDVLHSHPLAIDYGKHTASGLASDVRVFVGTNQGFLHQFDGDDGSAVWRFAPRAVMDQFKVWAADTAVKDRRYGVDGAPVAWVKDTDHDGVVEPAGKDGTSGTTDDEHVYLYFGLRRGGNAYYALDVTNPDTKPELLWFVDSHTPGFEELGRSFSVPRVAQMPLALDDNSETASVVRTVLVFAGGYDPAYDEGSIPAGNVVGNALFVVDAQTGDLIWKATDADGSVPAGASLWVHADFADPIPSTVTALDTDGDGYLDRLYVGDLGGRLWRADIGSANPNDWRAAPIASLGRHASDKTDGSDDRRFFHRPDVVRVGRGGGAFYAVVIGSGDRADPLDLATQNYLYVIKDGGGLASTADSTPVVPSDLADFAANCSSTQCASLLDPDFTQAGWKLALGGTAADRLGEKIVSTPTTVGGTILVTSYVPASGHSCRPMVGGGRLYAVNLLTAEPALSEFAVDGESIGYNAANGLNYDRGTPLRGGGMPAGVSYITANKFLASDYSIVDVPYRTVWRTYWRDRNASY